MTARQRRKFQVEQFILGAFLDDRHAYNWLGHLVNAEDFSSLPGKDHFQIFSAIQSLYPCYPINSRVVNVYTKRQFSYYLCYLTSRVCSSMNLGHDILQLHSINILEDLSRVVNTYLFSAEIEGHQVDVIQDLSKLIETSDEFDALKVLDEAIQSARESECPQDLISDVEQIQFTFDDRFSDLESKSHLHMVIEYMKSFGFIPRTTADDSELQQHIQGILAILSRGIYK